MIPSALAAPALRLARSSIEPRKTSAPVAASLAAGLIRSHQPGHLVAGREQFLDDGRADETDGTGDENTHAVTPC